MTKVTTNKLGNLFHLLSKAVIGVRGLSFTAAGDIISPETFAKQH